MVLLWLSVQFGVPVTIAE